MVAPVYAPLAAPSDMLDGPLSYILKGAKESFIAATLARASRNIEARCARRFAPFGPITQSERAEGVGSGVGNSDAPMSMSSALALSRARAFGSFGDMVRDSWLDEYAPLLPELWTYSAVSVTVTAPFGGAGQTVIPVEGPRPDTGHLRLPYGTYCPPGSTIAVTYSGGYTVATPDDLVQATILQATKLFILSIEPEKRSGLGTDDLDLEIDALIAPYARA